MSPKSANIDFMAIHPRLQGNNSKITHYAGRKGQKFACRKAPKGTKGFYRFMLCYSTVRGLDRKACCTRLFLSSA